MHAPAQEAFDVSPEEHVGAEKDLHIVAVGCADVLDDRRRVGGRAAVVGRALTAADVFTYMTTTACGYWAFQRPAARR